VSTSETVTVPGPRGELTAYLARPDGPGPHPAVVVIHDAMGLRPDTRNQADWLAAHGYLAVAPDLFGEGRTIARCLRDAIRDYATWEGAVFDDIEAVRDWARSRADASGRVGVIGYCFGGGFALMLAPPERGFDAVSSNYGQLPRELDGFFAGACPVVASFGGRDRTLRGAAVRLERALEDAGVVHDVAEYPSAGHGFLNDHGPGEVPALFVLMGAMLPTAYDPVAAEDARARILRFFDEHLAVAGHTP
jgi:carboxymethylenebutenolidase